MMNKIKKIRIYLIVLDIIERYLIFYIKPWNLKKYLVKKLRHYPIHLKFKSRKYIRISLYPKWVDKIITNYLFASHTTYSGSGTEYRHFYLHSEEDYAFVIRISDHDLNPGNYLPAGVIHEVSDAKFVTINLLIILLKEVIEMDKNDYETLWSNRLIY